MSEAFFLLPETRGVLSLTGEDRAAYLQGLITNDTAKLSTERALYAAFLTPQGKYLHDFSIAVLNAAGEERYLLDVEASRRADLLKRLSMYRLRSKVALADASADWVVAILYGATVLDTLGLPAEPGATKVFGNGIVFTDPRLAALGARAFLPRAEAAAWLSDAGLKQGELDAYDHLRLELGVPESGRDLIPDKSILLESGFDELNAIDWQKGCYMGQELTARTKYRGLVRKRLLPVKIDGATPQAGTPVMAGDKDIGEIRSHSTDGSIGIAMLRLEALGALRQGGTVTLQAGEATLTPLLPDWVQLPEAESATG
ncbi:MAG: folate-binding protein [Rhodospirillaceae bacterium]|nr:MAG: folate-binding protein [Rhodospirillaceae bacterium]